MFDSKSVQVLTVIFLVLGIASYALNLKRQLSRGDLRLLHFPAV